jgi:hypothetical protein
LVDAAATTQTTTNASQQALMTLIANEKVCMNAQKGE